MSVPQSPKRPSVQHVLLLWGLVLIAFVPFSLLYPHGQRIDYVESLSLPANLHFTAYGHPLRLYALVAAAATLLTLILVPVARSLARRLNVVDAPTESRKVHREAIPYLGGLPFYLCFLLTVFFFAHAFPQFKQPYFYPMSLVATLIVMMGLYDDVCDMSSLKKLLIELVLASVLFFWSFPTIEIAHPFGDTLSLGGLAFIMVPLWIAAVINAVNFSDGLDGLAAGLVFICAAAIFAIGIVHNQVVSCVLMACLMGTTLAFLRYNFNPASIFMGDAGALFLGFVLGTTTLFARQKGVAIIALAVPLVVLAVPLVDTCLSFYRRLLRARDGKFFHPDRDHLHHRLLDLGLSQRQVVLSLYYISACMGLLAFIFSVTPPPYNFLILLLAGSLVVFGVIVLRFIEGLSEGN